MRRALILLLLFLTSASYAEEYILNELCPESLYDMAENYFIKYPDIEASRDIRGIILRLKLKNPEQCCYQIDNETEKQLRIIEYFLAKIKNPVIIEVHTDKVPEGLNLKNWEFSTIIADRVEDVFAKEEPKIPLSRIYTVGYGESMPGANNTSNNSSNYSNRVDIIILCSISGE